jgi:hypothetical protein
MMYAPSQSSSLDELGIYRGDYEQNEELRLEEKVRKIRTKSK